MSASQQEERHLPTSFRIDVKREIVFVETSGMTSSVDLLRSFAALLDHPAHGPDMRLLLDMRKVVPLLPQPDVAMIGGFVREHAEMIGRLKIGVVVSTDDVFSIAERQKAEFEGSGCTMEVFREMCEVREWLGLSGDDVPQQDRDAVAG